jgi:hypothetical protein
MVNIALFLLILGLVVFGLERNHRRRRPPRRGGSTDPEDRDVARVRADLAGTAAGRRKWS